MQEINVEQIMQEIRAEIKEKGYQESDLSFYKIPVKDNVMDAEAFDEKRLQQLLHFANVSTRVDFYRPIMGNGPKSVLKKIVRKMMKPLLLPLCQEQEQYNACVVQTLNQMYQYIVLQEQKINTLEEIIDKEK